MSWAARWQQSGYAGVTPFKLDAAWQCGDLTFWLKAAALKAGQRAGAQ